MELKDKIIMIRKQNFLSQEQLAEKLNVTRQTVSKWELGETKPNIDILNQISEIFNINIEELTNNKLELNKKTKVKKKKNRKYILYILIILLIASLITLTIRIGNERENKENNFFDFFNNILDKNTKEFENEKNKLIINNGTKSSFLLKNDIDKIIENNKTNKEHLIEVTFDETTYGTDPNKIIEIKSKITDNFSSEYEISLEYDKEKYINKIIITTLQTISTSDFNNLLEFYSGTQYNPSVRNLLDEVIKSNNKYKDHLIEVIYQGTSYGTDTETIKNAKNKIGNNSFNNFEFITYEVTLDYDELGYVIKVSIEEL